MQFAQQQREQAGFAAAVRPHHADLLARVQGQVYAFEQYLAAAGEREFAQCDHCRSGLVLMQAAPAVRRE